MQIKYLRNICEGVRFYSHVAGQKPLILLKMNSFILSYLSVFLKIPRSRMFQNSFQWLVLHGCRTAILENISQWLLLLIFVVSILQNELLNLPQRRLLKDSAVPTLFPYCAGKQPPKRKASAGRQEKAAKKQVRQNHFFSIFEIVQLASTCLKHLYQHQKYVQK